MVITFAMGVIFLFHGGMVAATYGIDLYVADQVRLDGNISPTALSGAEEKAEDMSMTFKVLSNPAPVQLDEFVTVSYEIEVPLLFELGRQFGIITTISKNKTIMRTGER